MTMPSDTTRPTQRDLKQSFDIVADWMESYFEEAHGRECGMSCGGFIRACRDAALAGTESRKEKAERLTAQFVRFYRESVEAEGE